MTRFLMIGGLLAGLLGFAPDAANAQHVYRSGSYYRPGSSYSTPYGQWSHRPRYNYGGYGRHSHWHDTSHWDYHPGSFQRHRNHYHYVPGHYDWHQDGHWDHH